MPLVTVLTLSEIRADAAAWGLMMMQLHVKVPAG